LSLRSKKAGLENCALSAKIAERRKSLYVVSVLLQFPS